jgi:hypothetical protein
MELVDRYPNVLGKGFFGRLRIDIIQALLGLENIAVQADNQRIELGLQVFRRCAIRFNGQRFPKNSLTLVQNSCRQLKTRFFREIQKYFRPESQLKSGPISGRRFRRAGAP